tara:strand:- start:323 stop:553 length:231 start_codon:yes stop_codon:yes gene_type:complete
VGQVMTDTEGNNDGSSHLALLNVVSSVASIPRTSHAAVFRYCSQSIKDLIDGHVRKDPQHQIQERISADSEETKDK